MKFSVECLQLKVTMQKNIVETIGNTPLIDISEISPNNVKIFAKLESANLLGASKIEWQNTLLSLLKKKAI